MMECNCGSEYNQYNDRCNECLQGVFTDKYCPKCEAPLLTNKRGDVWCSYIKCNYGLEKINKKDEVIL